MTLANLVLSFINTEIPRQLPPDNVNCFIFDKLAWITKTLYTLVFSYFILCWFKDPGFVTQVEHPRNPELRDMHKQLCKVCRR